MLEERHAEAIGEWLVPIDSYHPFPTSSEREAWDALAPAVREAALAAGEQHLAFEWPQLSATLYMDFSRTGNRSRYERPCFARRSALARLVVAECVEGAGRFLDDIVNGIWAICDEATWVVPAHNTFTGYTESLPDVSDPFIDLFASDTGALLAWTQYLVGSRLDSVSERIGLRLRAELRQRILDPYLDHDDFWWMGRGDRWRLNNWSPWCVSNCLTASLLLEDDPARRTRAVLKSMQIVDQFLAGYHADGGCDEGASYWTVAGGALLDCLELLHSASCGTLDIYDEPLVREMGRYIHRMHISGDYYVNFADCNAKVHIPAGLVYRYGGRVADRQLSALGSWAYGRRGVEALFAGKLLRVLPDLFLTEGIDGDARPPLVRDVWLDGIQVMAARERDGSDRGLYLAAKGGFNNESHNHNDVGHFIVYHEGEPVLVDPGVGTYTAKTFGEHRYELWTMQSAYHNLPTVNGVQQREGNEFAAGDVQYRVEEAAAELQLDIAGAYPAEAGVESWRRTCRLVRGDDARVEITDEFALEAPTRDIMLSFMTPCEPDLSSPGVIALPVSHRSVRLTYDPDILAAFVERIDFDDERLGMSWGDHLFRVLLRAREEMDRGTFVTRIEGP